MSKPHQLGDAPIEPQYVEQMKAIARTLDEYLNGEERPKKNGFVVLMFPLEDHQGRCNYISNANREDIVVLLREQLRRFEGAPDVTGTA